MSSFSVVIPQLVSNHNYEDIKLPDGTKIPPVKDITSLYLNKSAIILGPTGTGKSQLMRNAIMELKDKIPLFIFVTAENSKKEYEDAAQNPDCLKSDLTKDYLIKLWKKQESESKIYNMVHDYTIIYKLFRKITKGTDRHIDEIRDNIQTQVTKLTLDPRVSETDKIKAMGKLKIDFEQYSVGYMRDKLVAYVQSDKNTVILTACEQILMSNLDINPNICLVLDDVTEKFKKWCDMFKKHKEDDMEDSVFAKIFYKGRHNYITLLFGCHDPTIIQPPAFRQSARVVIFGNEQMMETFIGCKSNGVSKELFKKCKTAGPSVYHNKNIDLEFAKLVYERDTAQPIKYTVAKMYSSLTMVGTQRVADQIKHYIEKKGKKTNNPTGNRYISYIT